MWQFSKLFFHSSLKLCQEIMKCQEKLTTHRAKYHHRFRWNSICENIIKYFCTTVLWYQSIISLKQYRYSIYIKLFPPRCPCGNVFQMAFNHRCQEWIHTGLCVQTVNHLLMSYHIFKYLHILANSNLTRKTDERKPSLIYE